MRDKRLNKKTKNGYVFKQFPTRYKNAKISLIIDYLK